MARAFEWYREALRLFKRHPVAFIALAVAVIAAELLLGVIPVVGRPLANIVVPIIACGLLYASLAADRGERPRAAHLIAAFAAPVASLGAVILASLVVFLAEWVIGWQLAGVNLLATDDSHALSAGEVLLVYTAGVAVSLPLTLVPVVALFEGAGVADSFAASVKGRHKEARYDDHRGLAGTYRMAVPEEGKLVMRDLPMRNALNEVLRDWYVGDCQAGVDRWNKRVLEAHGMSERITLPSRRFNRQVGVYAGQHFDPYGNQLSNEDWERRKYEWLPSPDDKRYLHSIQATPVYKPGQFANYIAPPQRGINRQPIDFEYVRTEQ